MPEPNLFKQRGNVMVVILIVLALACNMPGSGTPPAGTPQPTAFDPTNPGYPWVEGTAWFLAGTLSAKVTFH